VDENKMDQDYLNYHYILFLGLAYASFSIPWVGMMNGKSRTAETWVLKAWEVWKI